MTRRRMMTPDVAKRLSLAEQHEWFRANVSRRSLMKGGLVGTGSLLAANSLLAGGARADAATRRAVPTILRSSDRPTGSAVAPFGRHLMFGGDPTTQTRVVWQVPAKVKDPFLRIGTNPFDFGEKIEADVRPVTTLRSVTDPVQSVPPSAGPTIEQYYLHVELDQLKPGTTYYYAVGHEGSDPGAREGVSALASFCTADDGRAGPFTFTAFGDQGITYDAVATNNVISAQSPAFHLHAGDISYAEDDGSGLITDSYDPRVWDSFFTEAEGLAKHIPWMAVLGNHEMEAWYSPNGYGADECRFGFPGNGPSNSPSSYMFTYGNAAFLGLDGNDVSYEIPANLGFTGGAQASWLDTTLGNLRKRSDIDFIVAYFHNCTYSTCVVHASDGGARQFFAPLFDKHSVDLVINGHNHIYERTDPIRNGVPTRSAPIGSSVSAATDGTTYLAAGGAGESLYSFGVPDSYMGHVDLGDQAIHTYVNAPGETTVNETVHWSRSRYTGYSIIAADVAPRSFPGGKATMTVRTLAETGTEIDHFTLVR